MLRYETEYLALHWTAIHTHHTTKAQEELEDGEECYGSFPLSKTWQSHSETHRSRDYLHMTCTRSQTSKSTQYRWGKSSPGLTPHQEAVGSGYEQLLGEREPFCKDVSTGRFLPYSRRWSYIHTHMGNTKWTRWVIEVGKVEKMDRQIHPPIKRQT